MPHDIDACLSEGSGQPLYICDHCEENRLLRCSTCPAVLEQPQWYYGSKPRKLRLLIISTYVPSLILLCYAGDTFHCSTCIGRRVGVKSFSSGRQSTHLSSPARALLRQGSSELVTKGRTTEESLVTVEQKVDDDRGIEEPPPSNRRLRATAREFPCEEG